MHPSFAQYRFALQAIALVSALGGCATLPPPTAELAAAQQALTRADDADADQYAADAITRARAELAQAQAAMASGRDNEARELAAATTADADLAYALGTAARTRAEYEQRRAEIADLQQRLQLQADASAQDPLDIPPAVAADDAVRLQALDADPRLNSFAAYERLRAHQALDAAMAARGKRRDAAMRVAGQRVSIAELSARNEAARRAIEQLDRQRSDLLVQASRQEAERARQEAERMRIQAQIQAEEAQRLRAAAQAEATARQQAEDVIVDVGNAETAKLKAARERDAELARQEAELMAAGKSPTSQAKARPKRQAKPKPKSKAKP